MQMQDIITFMKNKLVVPGPGFCLALIRTRSGGCAEARSILLAPVLGVRSAGVRTVFSGAGRPSGTLEDRKKNYIKKWKDKKKKKKSVFFW